MIQHGLCGSDGKKDITATINVDNITTRLTIHGVTEENLSKFQKMQTERRNFPPPSQVWTADATRG